VLKALSLSRIFKDIQMSLEQQEVAVNSFKTTVRF